MLLMWYTSVYLNACKSTVTHHVYAAYGLLVWWLAVGISLLISGDHVPVARAFKTDHFTLIT